ncbi:MAG TPA: response regulator [Thiotrichaceae bacterium]|jgi:two-component system chemotaxis response regulator CheY|nr:response regulator [Thiotrichaceae bacterium]HIM08992.1 response regulator [Gammaproteobacteria bacterium]
MATIMAVDDAKTMRSMVQTILGHKDHTVITAEDGVDALKKLTNNDIDMAVVDFHMPNMNGTTLIRRLRRLPKCKDIPILMLTTESSQFRKDKAREVGANGWLTKPFDPTTLTKAVETLLAKHGNN